MNTIKNLAYELTYHSYVLNKAKKLSLFRDISMREYIALHKISEMNSEGKIYLRELAANMQLSISQASRLVAILQDKGFIVWAHDGIGEEGTYIMITENGSDTICKQEQNLKQYYARVIEKFGEERLIALFNEMRDFEDILNEEILAWEDTDDTNDE